MSVDHENGVCAGRRMNGFCQQHESESQRLRERIDPKGVSERLIARDADQGTPEVPAEQRARLSGGRSREAEQDDG